MSETVAHSMTDVRVQIPTVFLERMKDAMHLRTNTDVVQEAMTLLGWAVEERERDRLILSTNRDGGQVERLAMRSLNVVEPKERNPHQERRRSAA